MKKLLGILVLGLFLSSCGARLSNEIQKSYIKSDVIKIGMEFSEFRKFFNRTRLGWYRVVNANNNKQPKYLHSGNASYLASTYNIYNISYGLESTKGSNLKDFKLTKIFNNNLEALDYYINLNPSDNKEKANLIRWKTRIEIIQYESLVKEKRRKKIIAAKKQEEEKKIIAKKQEEENRIITEINKAKDICKKAGYKPNTDKLADCTIKMLTKSKKTGASTIILNTNMGGSENRNRLLRPYPLGCRSMGGNWGC